MNAGALCHPQQGPLLAGHKTAAKRHGKARRRSHIRVGIAHHFMQSSQRQTGPTAQTAVNLRRAKQERGRTCPLRLKA